MIEIISVKDIKDATPEELANLRRKGLLPAEETRRISGRPLSPYERTRAQVADGKLYCHAQLKGAIYGNK